MTHDLIMSTLLINEHPKNEYITMPADVKNPMTTFHPAKYLAFILKIDITAPEITKPKAEKITVPVP